MLKPKFELDSLSEDSEDIHLQTKLATYLKRPTQLDSLTYQWWCSANQDVQKEAAQAKSQRVIKCKSADDFSGAPVRLALARLPPPPSFFIVAIQQPGSS